MGVIYSRIGEKASEPDISLDTTSLRNPLQILLLRSSELKQVN